MNNQERQKLTKWLRNEIKLTEAARDEIPFGLDHSSEMALKSFKVALASLESQQPEPVAYTAKDNIDGFGRSVGYMWPPGNQKPSDIPLYTAPHAPVMQPVKRPSRIKNIDLRSPLEVEDMLRCFYDANIRAAGYPVEE